MKKGPGVLAAPFVAHPSAAVVSGGQTILPAAAITGKRNVHLPAKSRATFALRYPVKVRGAA
jgi:hypothetical protein